jgi:hypothetical protein
MYAQIIIEPTVDNGESGESTVNNLPTNSVAENDDGRWSTDEEEDAREERRRAQIWSQVSLGEEEAEEERRVRDDNRMLQDFATPHFPKLPAIRKIERRAQLAHRNKPMGVMYMS